MRGRVKVEKIAGFGWAIYRDGKLWRTRKRMAAVNAPPAPSGVTLPDRQPTEAEREVARDYANAPGWTEPSREYWADHIAAALAAQRAEIHRRYEAVAEALEHYARKTEGGTWSDGALEAASRIRDEIGNHQ